MESIITAHTVSISDRDRGLMEFSAADGSQILHFDVLRSGAVTVLAVLEPRPTDNTERIYRIHICKIGEKVDPNWKFVASHIWENVPYFLFEETLGA